MSYVSLILALAAIGLITCGDKPVDPVDSTPPTISSISPSPGSDEVVLDATISVTFSEAIHSNSVTTSSFGLSGGVSGTYVTDSNQVTFTPSTQLAYGSTYTVTLTRGIKDLAGNGLADDSSWSFTTVADPTTLPPVLLSAAPADSAVDVPIGTTITATFSKGMDATTLTPVSFALNNGVTGAVATADNTATFSPDSDLDYSTTYIATVTTVVADTFGVHLAARETWSFTTEADPVVPEVTVDYPFNRAIVGDTVTLTASVTHPTAIDSVVFFVDGSSVGSVNSEPYTFLYGDTMLDIGGVHILTARAYDSEGRIGSSTQTLFYYQFEELVTDGNAEALPLDVRSMHARTTDSLLELRYAFSAEWGDAVNDTALDMGIYIDSDHNPATGDQTFGDTIFPVLNGIGADHRVIIGIHGLIALAEWNSGTQHWDSVYTPDGLAWLWLPDSSDVFEFGITWSDLGDADTVDIVSINVFWQTTDAMVPDWIPDEGSGFVTIPRVNRWIGESPTPEPPGTVHPPPLSVNRRANPFGN